MDKSRDSIIEDLAGEGKLKALKAILEPNYTQLEIDLAFASAIAYSQLETAEYLFSLGASFSRHYYDGTYYAVHNNKLEGLKFAIKHGVDININEGGLLNTSIVTAFNQKDTTILKWLLENGADTSLLSISTLEAFSTSEIKAVLKHYI
ncbi:hypothetical protein [Chondrinema litorale]|uniref:hypothetical protein n=1 Tax=Chondrinema litorale TaxID=2994555 RepID=UPI002543E44C|nr:hypothetical protein [Chondrinema litorale]UZR99998.1 hypothetical protein OQ292_39140 [Chondrinema litorale]